MATPAVYLPKDIESIITKKKTDMEMMGLLIVLESVDMLIERNMKDAAHHFTIKCRNITRTFKTENAGGADGNGEVNHIVTCHGDFRVPMISRGKHCAVALMKAFFANYIVNNEIDDDDMDDYMEEDIGIYLLQSASSIEEACKIENRNSKKLTEISSMYCCEIIFSQLFTAHMKKLWITLDNLVDFIGSNELGDAKKIDAN